MALVMTATESANTQNEQKKAVARAAVGVLRSGMHLGLGSGSTSQEFIRLLGEKMQSGALRVDGIATSVESENLARQCGIPLIEPERGLKLDLAVDGADEIGPGLSLIKGGGGAHLREKVIARAARYFLVIADASKVVPRLGRFPLPLEVVPFSLPWVMDEVAGLGCKPVQRMSKNSAQPYKTDQQNFIVDCHFGQIVDAEKLARQLQQIPGIVEHGLFLGYAKAALVANDGRVAAMLPDGRSKPVEELSELP
jgi:ribose 5-phosphate isomerase A